jgi:hypothetical protein
MKELFRAVAISLLAPALMLAAHAGPVVSQADSGRTNPASCIILKRMGPADEVTSHLYSFGIRGKQFQWVEGKFPEGTSFHGRLTDHDVRNLQGRGAQVLVLEPHYTSQDLKDARAQCQGTNSTNQASEPKANSQPDKEIQPATIPAAPASSAQASISIESAPAGADIEIDGAFVGNTPSTVAVSPGVHQIAIKKKGFLDWSKKLSVTGGSIHLNAELELENAK